MQLKALIMNVKDNVATAVYPLNKGETLILDCGGSLVEVEVRNIIPFGHKIALKDIGQGEKIVKYGEIIGQSTSAIEKGEHVHIQNVEGLRGRGDKS